MKINEKIIPPKILNTSFNLKSTISYLLLYILIITQNGTTLEAKEPLLATLTHIYSNTLQKIRIANDSYVCKTYGVIGLDDLYNKSKSSSSCYKNITEFYLNHPKNKYFVEYIMHVGAMYHVEFINNGCILYVKGEVSISELLLKNGLAKLKKKFSSPEHKERYKVLELRAKNNKQGIWSKKIMINCLVEMN